MEVVKSKGGWTVIRYFSNHGSKANKYVNRTVDAAIVF
jgi:hypothetical protein